MILHCSCIQIFSSLLENRKKDIVKVELELKTLKEKYNTSIDLWNKEKTEMQVSSKYNFM